MRIWGETASPRPAFPAGPPPSPLQEQREQRAEDAGPEEDQEHDHPGRHPALGRAGAERAEPRADPVADPGPGIPALGVQVGAADGASGGEWTHRLTAIGASTAVRHRIQGCRASRRNGTPTNVDPRTYTVCGERL